MEVIQKASSVATISNVEDSGSTVIKITSNGVHGLSTGDMVVISGVMGTTEANGFWPITVTSTTTFTLDGSTYANAWTGSGTIYVGDYITATGSASVSCDVIVCLKQWDTTNNVVYDIATQKTNITGTSATTIVTPSAAYSLAVTSINYRNNHGSTSQTLTLKYNTYDGDSYTLLTATVAAGSRLVLTESGGLLIIDSTGTYANSYPPV